MKGGCGSCGECMHGRGIICNHPVTRITGTPTLTSPFSAASKKGPFGILFNGLHADIIEQKCYTRETCRFGNRTHQPMSLKTSALVSHQKRFEILLTYAQLGNHTRKHRVKQIRDNSWIHKSQQLKQDPCGHINAPKVFRRRLQVRLDSGRTCIVSRQIRMRLFASLHLYLVCCDHFRYIFELTGL